jgi:hypothetical protein
MLVSPERAFREPKVRALLLEVTKAVDACASQTLPGVVELL